MGNGAEKGHIKQALMGLPIFSHQTGPVHSDDHRQTADGQIVDQLVIAPLQEGGINADVYKRQV